MPFPPSVSCLHFGFWILRLVPTPTSIGLRFVFPFEYLHRLHYDSMIGPALVYPRVPHGPWTYEPHAQGRTLSSTFYFGLGISFVLKSGFAYFYVCLGTSLSSFWVPASSFSIGSDFFCLPSFRLMSPSPGLVLVPLSATLSATSGPQYEVWENL